MEFTWSVVKFIEENSVEAVPTSWINNGICFWPQYPKSRLKNAIQNSEAPDEVSWAQHEVHLFRNNVYDTYEEAVYKSKKATETSDLESQTEYESEHQDPKKRIIKKKIFTSYTSFEENEENEPPRKILKKPPALKAHLPKTSEVKRILVNYSQKQRNQSSASQPVLSENKQAENLSNADLIDEGDSFHNASGSGTINNQFAGPSIRGTDDGLKDMVHKMLQKQNIMRGILSEVKNDLEEIKQALKHTNTTPIETEEASILTAFQHFPIGNDNDLQELENLLSDKGTFSKAVNELIKIGGRNAYEFIFRIGKEVITSNYASTFSWHGKKQKKPLKLSIIGSLFQSSTLKLFPNITLKQFEEDMMKWSKRCKERK